MNAPDPAPCFLLAAPAGPRPPLRDAIDDAWLSDETALIHRLLGIAELPAERSDAVATIAARWVRRVRQQAADQGALDAFMREYDLSTNEGVMLMCLAEALLRIPDEDTAEALIADKLAEADWEAHLGRSESLFVNASTWGLMLTGRMVRAPAVDDPNAFRAAWTRLVSRSTEPVVRLAIRSAMRMMGSQFVMGRTIDEALASARASARHGVQHSYDMLGEAALTATDAERYLHAYRAAIAAIGTAAQDLPPGLADRPGISVKLSALHPRHEPHQRARVLEEATPRLLLLAQDARACGISLCVDAEEADRLSLALDLFEAVLRDPSLHGWDGFGLAVQAFQKRALATIEWLEWLARDSGRRIPVRLVKGAYWDTEIKRAQEAGLSGYPVFTRKANTDVAYLACARRLMAARALLYPQFATHNAHTIATVKAFAAESGIGDGLCGFEFQRLHGMGEALYAIVQEDCAIPCRVYAPVGAHADLLPYLVRRLLENGANTSFVNRIFDDATPAEQLGADPVAAVRALAVKPNPVLPLPGELYGAARRNSSGINLADDRAVARLAEALHDAPMPVPATSLCYDGPAAVTAPRPITAPADRRVRVGTWQPFDPARVGDIVNAAAGSCARWNATAVAARAAMLERAADRLDAEPAPFLRALVLEAGKTVPDACAEVREAVDLLRYYAAGARRLLACAEPLTGPTGEHNELQLHGRGVFVCISPWNFPLAIFLGQIAAALVAGNPVIAKPAEQTPLVASLGARLLHEAGVPSYVFQCLLGDGALGAALVDSAQIAGVAFTGSFAVAQTINRRLAARSGPIATLIAETGGQNVMIADSSSLPEQVVRDALTSAFGAAGQRCSALRVLALQDDIADRTIAMLRGAMRERVIGDPARLATDIGPVIDADAVAALDAHLNHLVGSGRGRIIERLPLPERCAHGSYFPPTAVQIDTLDSLPGEAFGPILHLLRYPARRLDALVDAINATGYGLTLGVHSRIEGTWRRIQARAKVGNVYVNRAMTGAVVGVQPFGGEGLSGTGPKAGGPHYLLRFTTERCLSVNTAAVGGNARLLSQSG